MGGDRVHLPGVIAREIGVSTSEARRLINQGGVKVEGSPVLDFDPPRSTLAGKRVTVGWKHSFVIEEPTDWEQLAREGGIADD